MALKFLRYLHRQKSYSLLKKHLVDLEAETLDEATAAPEVVAT